MQAKKLEKEENEKYNKLATIEEKPPKKPFDPKPSLTFSQYNFVMEN